MPEPRHILLLISTEYSYGREVMLGAVSHARERGLPWIFRQFAPAMQNMRAVRHWRPDGVIGHLHDAAVSRAVRGMGLPVVDFSSRLDVPGFAHVRVDDAAIGAEAARHFMDIGLTHGAFVGFPGVPFSDERRRGFAMAMQQAGRVAEVFLHSPHHIHAPTNLQWTREFRRLGRWLQGLPKPVGVFAANDRAGVEITDACRMLGLAVPDEVAVVVVNNDDLLCRIADPPLSSVESPMTQVGIESAKLLHRMLGRKPVRRTPLLIQPRGVVTRRSSDTLAAKDPVVARALACMHRHADRPINVEHVLEQVHVSRSLLERKFREALGRTPLAELRRIRLQRAKTLLRDTDLPVSDIAHACGFSGAVRFSSVFRQVEGLSPTQYRTGLQHIRLHTHDAGKAGE